MKNKKLYDALARRFGEVRIANENEAMVYTVINDNGRKRVKVISGGEYYRVNCPYCGDTRGRLWINYRWNTVEILPDYDHKLYFGKYLAVCYNEHCSLDLLEDELKPYIARNYQLEAHVSKSEVCSANAVRSFHPVELPGDCYPINILSTEHPARSYLSSRGFNIDYLFHMYGVYYCAASYPEYFSSNPYRPVEGQLELARQQAAVVENRIIFEIYKSGQRVGWQARYVGSPQNKYIPKYFTMPAFPRSHWLYGYDAAVSYPYVVVVEGVLDVIRLGPPAVALLSSNISAAQKTLLHGVWRSDQIVLALDPDVNKVFPGYRRVMLPEGRDPGDLSFNENWDIIKSQTGIDHISR